MARRILVLVLLCASAAPVAAQRTSYAADEFRPATLQDLAKPRVAPAMHLVRTTFPGAGARRDASPETRASVRKWLGRRELPAALAELMTREYRVEGTWIVFLEWTDLAAAIAQGEKVRLYLDDIGPRDGAPQMAALIVHRGWPETISNLDHAILAHIARREPLYQADLDAIGPRFGVSASEARSALSSLARRGLLRRGPSDDRLRPGTIISVEGSRLLGRINDGDRLALSGWMRFEREARDRMDSIRGCLAAFAARSPDRGFPAHLAAAGCETGEMALGYRFRYFPGVPDAQGRIAIFGICGQPALTAGTGFKTYAVDEQAGHVLSAVRGEPFDRPIDCAAAFARDHRTMRQCVIEHAAANPQRGYPADLTPIGPPGNNCLGALQLRPTPSERWFNARDAAEYNGRIYTYLPGKPLPDGRIASFEIRWTDRNTHVETVFSSDGTMRTPEERARN